MLLIVNPLARGVTAHVRAHVERLLRVEHDVSVIETTRPGRATSLARTAAALGTDAVAVLGGDGVLNEAANGLAGTEAILLPVPAGSTNVFARSIGLPNNAPAATKTLLESLAAGSVRPVGAGRANGRLFLCNAGVGFDAAVIARVEARRRLKRRLGHLWFVGAAVDTWLRGLDRRAPHLSLALADEPSTPAYFVLFVNSDPYTYLYRWPIRLGPAGTGLTVAAGLTLRLGPVLRTTGAALRLGPRAGVGRAVSLRPGVSRAAIEADRPMPLQLDGEFVGCVERVEVAYQPEALRVAVPAAGPTLRRGATPLSGEQ
ncbi:MAG: diacylglycerol/lipid kinase family protein [Acidimicrobiales bacterium]